MTIKLNISHPDRMIVGVATGALTIQDLERFLAELVAANAFRYRKIIDVMGATPGMTAEELAAFIARVEAVRPKESGSGPIAIVAREGDSPLARLFAELTAGKRLAGVFRNIREAREWLYANSRII
jgi:hypothetical protein